MDIQILPSGALRLSLAPYQIENVRERSEEVDEVSLLIELSEPYWTNGSFQPFDAGHGNPFVGLTSAPCIAESLSHDDNGLSVEGRLWWFPDYAVTSLVEVLLEKGSVEFPLAPGYEPVEIRRPAPGR